MDLFIDYLVTKHFREISRCFCDHKSYHLAQARLFTQWVKDIKLIVFFGHTGITNITGILLLKFFLLVGLLGNNDHGSQITHTFDEFSKNFHFRLDATKLGCKDCACLVEDIVGNSKVFMGVVHAFTDVMGRTVKLPFEKMEELKLEQLHFLLITKLLVVASEFIDSHNTIKEIVNKQLHFRFTTQLIE